MKKLFTLFALLMPISTFALNLINNFEWLEPNNKVEIVVGESYQLKFNCSDNSLPFTSAYADNWNHYDFDGGQHMVSTPTGYSINEKGVITGLVPGSYAIKFTGYIQPKDGVDKMLMITVVSERSEVESNNTLDTANEITNKIRFGLYNISDEDYFKFTNSILKWGDEVTFKIHYYGSREEPFGYKWSTFCGTDMVGSGSLISQDQECKALVTSGNTVYLEVYYDQSRSQYFNYGEEFVAEVYINGIPASDIKSGNCGDNLTWSYSKSTKTLTISGTGEMWDYEKSLSVNNPSPWNDLIDEIEIISIEEGVSSIGNFAFKDCTNAIKVFIPLSVTSIGVYSFYNCTSLSEISNLTNVSTIGGYAFCFCSSLTSVTFGDKLSTIGSSAFSGCKGLTSLTIPSSVTSIDYLAFYVCTGIDKIIVEEGNMEYDSREDCNALIQTSTNTLLLGCKNTIIPNGVTCINGYAFSEINEITSIVIPNSVTVINPYAFYGCTNLTRVVLGDELKQIYMYAFSECPLLADVFCYAKNVPEALFWGREKAFDGEENIILHVPAASIDAYKSTAPWSGFKEIIALTDSDPSGITTPSNDSSQEIIGIYDLRGNKHDGFVRGINIIKYKNGSSKKVVK